MTRDDADDLLHEDELEPETLLEVEKTAGGVRVPVLLPGQASSPTRAGHCAGDCAHSART